MRGILYLEDGTVYRGKGFGASATRVGELVFNTAMAGYQKTLTDPSYSEQILTMTYPLIGNYGINDTDFESDRIFAFGLVVKDVCFRPSNWKCEKNIDMWLKEMNVPGVYDVDTREITRKIRNSGNQKCVISTEELTIDEIKKLCEETELRGDQMPVFGICMGHQIIALSQGGKTYKLQYGHRGCNHGVFDKKTGRSYITSQNHGYAVSADSVVLKGLDVTHLNLNDGTVEGMEHISKPVFSVQFHPESNPGPHDTGYLFDKFIDLMKGGRL